MSIRIGSNISSLQTTRRLAEVTETVASASLRLATGRRINRASDDAAGLSIAGSLRNDSRVFTQAIRNVNDSISSLNIADGALEAVTSVVIRLKELSEQSANGTFSRTQRLSLDGEADLLTREFNRILETTSFNGIKLLNGSFSQMVAQLGYGTDGTISYSAGAGLQRRVGTGTFATPTVVGQNLVFDAQAIDYDNDGILDVIGSNPGYLGVRLLKGNGNGTFQGTTLLSNSGAGSVGIEAADFTGDGVTDIAMALNNGRIEIFRGSSGGSFSYLSSFDTGTANIETLSSADFNGDGLSDLYVGGSTATTNSFVLLNQAGQLSLSQTIVNGATNATAALGDFNGDGKTDLALSTGANSTIRIMSGNGNGTFALMTTVQDASNFSYLTAGDLDNDGVDELVGSYGRIFGRTSSGSFALKQTITAFGNNQANSRIVDIDGDGYKDLVSADNTGSTLRVYKNNQNGQIQSTGIDSTSGGSILAALLVEDFNGDGVRDIFYARGSGSQFSSGNSTTATYLERVDLKSQSSARTALDSLDAVLRRIQSERGSIGASMSRFESALGVLRGTVENSEAAAGRIQDADVAQESARLVRSQILQQVTANILAQANLQPQIALQLLR